MTMYSICSRCKDKIPYGSKCNKCSRDSYKEYKRFRTDIKEQRFYSSKAWRILSEQIKRKHLGMCLDCWSNGNINDCSTSHHIVEIKDVWDKRLDEDNLICLCSSCHAKVHREYNKDNDSKVQEQQRLVDIVKRFNNTYNL